VNPCWNSSWHTDHMAMLGTAAALTAGAAAAAVALQQDWCLTGAQAVFVPVKKRASTATTASCEAYCSIPDMLRGKRYITLVGDMLMFAQEAGKAEGSVHLQGARTTWHLREVRTTKDSELLISLTFDTENEAEFWAEKIKTSSMMSENLPKLFSLQRRQMQHLGQKNQEFSSANAQISKLLSSKRRECFEVEQKARFYEEDVGRQSKEVKNLTARAADFQQMASQRELEMKYLHDKLEEQKKQFLQERMSIETKVQAVVAEADLRRNEVAELSAEVITAETEAEEKEIQLRSLASMHQVTEDQMAMVQDRLMQMQQLLAAQDEAEAEAEEEEEPEELFRHHRFSTPAALTSRRLQWEH